jgi:hypothetical protein
LVFFFLTAEDFVCASMFIVQHFICQRMRIYWQIEASK